MGLRRGPDRRVALGPAPHHAAESRLQRAAGPRDWEGWGGLCPSVYLSSASPGPTPIPKGVCRLCLSPASGPRDHLRPYLALEPRVHRACWPATFCRDPPPPDYRVRLFRTLWTVARLPGSSVCGTLQARVLSRLQCPPPGGLPAPGIKPGSPAPSALHADSFPMSHSLSPKESSTSCRC